MCGNGRAGKHDGGPFREERQDLPVQLRGRGRGACGRRAGVAPLPRASRTGGEGCSGGASPFPPGAARPTHLRGLQPHPHLPHQKGLQAAARGAEEAGARCGPGLGICGPRRRRHGCWDGQGHVAPARARRSQGHVVRGAHGAVPRSQGPLEWGAGVIDGRVELEAHGAEEAQGRPRG